MVGSGSGNEGGAGGPPDDGVVVASSRTGGSSSKQQRPLGRFGGASLDDASKGASIAVAYNSDTSISVIPRDEVAVASEYNEANKLPALKKLVYGAPSFAIQAMTVLIGSQGMDFYLSFGALLPYLSLFVAIARSLDIVTDLSMGWLSDNTRTKWGRRRPYMALGGIPFAVLFVVFFSPPAALGPFEISMWFGVFYVLFYLGDTLTVTPYQAWGSELTDDSKDRSNVFFVVRLWAIVGSIFSAILPGILQRYFIFQPGFADVASATRTAYTVAALVFAGWYVLTNYILIAYVEERDLPSKQAEKEVPLVPSILRSFRNPAIKSLILAWFMDGLQAGILITLLPFYLRYYIQPDGPAAVAAGQVIAPTSFIGLSIMVVMIGGVVGAPIWLFISAKTSKFKAWIIFNVAGNALNLLLLFPKPGQTYLTLVFAFLLGIPYGGDFLNNSIMLDAPVRGSATSTLGFFVSLICGYYSSQADVIDYEELLQGTRSEGVFSVYGSLIAKTVAIPASAIPMGILSMLGFVYPVNGIQQPQPQGVLDFLYFGVVFFSFGTGLLGTLGRLLFPLKEADAIEQIQKMTTEVNAGQTGTDPVTGRRFRRISFTEKEQEIVWLLENFDYNVMWNKTGQQLAKRTGWQVVAFSLVSACLAVLTGWAMWWLHDPNLALYTTLAVIATSYSLCWLYVCFSGHLDALKLARMDQDEVRSVIKRLRNGYDIQGV